jgi:hypothetical protein
MGGCLDAALTFAELGCRVVPEIGKNPGAILGDGWQEKATRDPDRIRDWFRRHPRANVGILGDRVLLPLDVDDAEAFEQLQTETIAAPETPRYWTQGADGRERLLFAFPGDEALAGVGRELAEGVQLRHSNTSALQCLIPPSVNPESGLEQDWRIRPDEAPFARIPSEWLERVQPAAGRAGKPRSHWVELVQRHYHTGCGQTHPDVVSLAAFLVKKLGSGRLALELLLPWNAVHCHPPKPAEEITEIVAWAARKEARQ